MIGKLERARVSVVFDRRGVAHDDVAGTVEIMIYEPRVRRRRYVSTGVRVRACEWDDRYWVVGRGDARALNDRIREQVAKCEGAIDVDGCDAAVACIKSSRAGDSFLRWMEDEIEASPLEDSTKRQHMVMLRNLEQCGRMSRFDCVTSRNIEAWLDGIRATGADQVTVHGYYKRLRKWVNVAIRKRMLPADCLVEMSVPRGKSKERSFLTDDEIETVRSLQLPNAHLCNARDRFLVQMGCGLSYSDFVDVDFTRHQLLGGHETLQGRRKKTGEQFFLVMLPFAVEILDRWGWVVPPISNAKYNDYLSTIMMIAGIDKKVTSHVARHSYACYCLRHGVRIEAVQRTLGHSDIKTTQIYARLVDMDVVDAFGHLK